MYTPKYFKMSGRKEIYEFIEQNSFAILVSQNDLKLNATHLPLILKKHEGNNGYLYGHAAKANQQFINCSENVLVIYPGAHKYISSSWYESDQSVPTWNYLSVHIYGKITIIEDLAAKSEIVKDTVKYFEDEKSPYKTENLKEKYFEGLLNGITAFKIEITEIEGKKKISQNHTEERQQLIIENLEKNSDTDSLEIVSEMKNNLSKNQK